MSRSNCVTINTHTKLTYPRTLKSDRAFGIGPEVHSCDEACYSSIVQHQHVVSIIHNIRPTLRSLSHRKHPIVCALPSHLQIANESARIRPRVPTKPFMCGGSTLPSDPTIASHQPHTSSSK